MAKMNTELNLVFKSYYCIYIYNSASLTVVSWIPVGNDRAHGTP